MSTPPPHQQHSSPTEEEEPEHQLEEYEKDVPLDPLITLLHARHTFNSQYSTQEEREAVKAAMLEELHEHNMAPYLRMVRDALGWDVNEDDLTKMDEINAKKIAVLDARLKDAQENLGDVEIRDILQEKCAHYARIGDLENCLQVNQECTDKTIAAGPKLDLCFQRIRLGIAFSDNEIAAKGITDATRLLKDGDWERRNRLKVYEGIYYLFVRDFKRASQRLLDSVTTFASGELISFKDFIFATCIASLPILSRAELKKKIVDSPEVISADVSDIYDLVTSIHSCRYQNVFPALDAVCQHQRRLVFVAAHVNYFFREVRVLVFTQFLDSYSSVTLQSMGNAFGIPVQVLDQMLGTLISNERIACKIDRQNNSVKTYRGDTTNFDYHKIVKNGDLLLNRIQKLSRLVDM